MKNLSTSAFIKYNLDEYVKRVTSESPICVLARQGELTNWQLANFIFNIHYLIEKSVTFLKYSKQRCQEMKKNELAAFFGEKAQEEMGHEKWAENDLENIALSEEERVDLFITPQMKKIRAHTEMIARERPESFLVYQLFLEYITIMIAPRWIKDLEEKCGKNISQVSVLSKHAELDVEHVQSDLKVIDQFINQSETRVAAKEDLEYFKDLMFQHYHEVTNSHVNS